MSTRRGKVMFVIGVLIVGALTFMLASAYLIERDQPKWLAAAVGALAFPVLPVLWQVIGERRRRAQLATEKKAPPKDALSGSDRYLFRTIGVMLVVLGPMFVIGKTDVLHAAWAHKTWFLPEPSLAERQEAMLAHVPGDAELVIVGQGGGSNGGSNKDDKSKHEQLAVMAIGGHDAMAMAASDSDEVKSFADRLKELNDNRDKIPFLKIDPLVAADVGGGFDGAATVGWKAKVEAGTTGPSSELRAELARVPADAKLAFVYVPAKAIAKVDLKHASAWLTQTAVNEKIVIDAQLEATTLAAADKLVEQLKVLYKLADVPAKCRDAVNDIAGDIQTFKAGTVVTAHLEIQPDKLWPLLTCGLN